MKKNEKIKCSSEIESNEEVSINKESKTLIYNENTDKFVGRHLIIDAQTRTARGINEPSTIYNLLENLSKVLKMTLVYPPIVARFPWANSELERFVENLREEGVYTKTIEQMEKLIQNRSDNFAGVSGITIWLESHAAIHTWTEENFFSFDAYSCKDFDPQTALDYILPHFDIISYNGLDITRTINAPQKVTAFSNKLILNEA